MTVDWLFAPTDNINLLIEVAVGLVATAWVAGWWSLRKNKAWLNSSDSDPYIGKIVSKVAEAVKAEIPAVPVFEGEVVEKPIFAAIERYTPRLFEALAQRTGQQIAAFYASQRAEMEAFLRRTSREGLSGDPQGQYLLTLLANVVGKKEAATLMAIKQLISQNKPGGQQQAYAPQYQQPAAQQWRPGMIANGHVLLETGQWIPMNGGQQPGPTYPGFAAAPLYPGGPNIPTPGAGAPAGYTPEPLTLPPATMDVEASPPDARSVPKRDEVREPEVKAE